MRVIVLHDGDHEALQQAEALLEHLYLPENNCIVFQDADKAARQKTNQGLLPYIASVVWDCCASVMNMPVYLAAREAAAAVGMAAGSSRSGDNGDDGSATAAVLIVCAAAAAEAVAVKLKALLPDQSLLLVLHRPRCRQQLYDVAAIPAYDVFSHPHIIAQHNVVVTKARLSHTRYSAAYRSHSMRAMAAQHSTEVELPCLHSHWFRSKDAAALTVSALEHPILVIAAGQPTPGCRWRSSMMAHDIISMTQHAIASRIAASAVVCFSQHTPRALRVALMSTPLFKEWTGDYVEAMSYADCICVTADSIAMMSQAAALGKPMMVVGGSCCRCPRLSAFHAQLLADDICCTWTAQHGFCQPQNLKTPYMPYNDAKRVAHKVHELLWQRGLLRPPVHDLSVMQHAAHVSKDHAALSQRSETSTPVRQQQRISASVMHSPVHQVVDTEDADLLLMRRLASGAATADAAGDCKLQ